MNGQREMTELLRLVEAIYHSTPELSEFGEWPSDLSPAQIPQKHIPAANIIMSLPDKGVPETQEIVQAIQEAAPFANWTQTYTVEEVGQDFLDRYGYFELFGPYGNFHTDHLRGFVGFWDTNLDYGWHDHEAEELYFGLSGSGLFKAEGEENRRIGPGDAKYHRSFQAHAMETIDDHFLCLAFWRGSGMADLPKMKS